MNFYNPYNTYRAPQHTPIDQEKFNQGALQLNQEMLVQLVKQARAQGIPEAQIEAGLNYILSLKNS